MNYRRVSQVGLLISLLLVSGSFTNPEWQSKYLKVTNGKLTYIPDDKGNIIPDFSRVGYHQGDMDIPDVKIVKTVTAPNEGSSQELIQQAIDEIAQLTPDKNGFRGAILLKKGTYRIPGSILIKTGGIILKGEGNDENGTVVIASGKGQRSLFKISGKSSAHEIKETKIMITDSYVPVGSFSFQIEDVKGLQVGNLIWMVRPGTENWIHDLKMDQIDERVGTKQWKASDYDLKFERVISRIEGNRIYIDQPVVMSMDQKYGGGYITRITDERIAENGIENILIKSENWCIGLIGNKSNGRLEGRPDGEWEGFNQPGLIPSSLYEAQKTDRK